MGSFSTNPQTMTLGIISPSSLTPRAATQPVETRPVTTTTATPAATDMSRCHPCTIQELTFGYRQAGVTVRKDPVTGRLMCCPKQAVDPTIPVTPKPADDGTTPTPGTDTTPQQTLGEFAWPQELMDLYGLLIDRGKDLLGNPGFSDKALAYAFGTDFEKVRGQEAAARQSLTDQASRMGLLGSGTFGQQLADLAWGTEGNVANVMRDVFLKNEEQKRSDIGLGQSLFGSGMNYSQALEAINAARRGEGTAALLALLQLLSIMKG